MRRRSIALTSPKTRRPRASKASKQENAEPSGPAVSELNPAAAQKPSPVSASSKGEWLVWQLADSAFPVGGFAHSGGLEAAWQHGEVRGRQELVAFVETSMEQVKYGSLPLVMAAYREPERLGEWDALSDAFLNNHVANRASRLQGKAFLAAMKRIFFQPNPAETSPGAAWPGPGNAFRIDGALKLPFFHFNPVFGASMRQLGIPQATAARLFVFQHVRSVLAAAVRLGIVGPMDSQIVQTQLAGPAETLSDVSRIPDLSELAQTSPLLDLWQGAHDRLYSRLFQS